MQLTRPITPRRHAAIDYGFLLVGLAVPTLLGLNGAARVLFAALALGQTTLNAFTDHSLALKRLVPFKLHGRIELSNVPVYFGLPFLVGAIDGARALAFYLVTGATLLSVFFLTDWNARDPAASADQPKP
jgi:hypothetical protein